MTGLRERAFNGSPLESSACDRVLLGLVVDISAAWHLAFGYEGRSKRFLYISCLVGFEDINYCSS